MRGSLLSERQNYWSRDQQGHSEWQGKLAEQWGLSGAVGNEHFARLTEGQHPSNGSAACSPSGFHNLRRQIRQGSNERRTSCGLGCYVLRAEVCFSDRTCRRR